MNSPARTTGQRARIAAARCPWLHVGGFTLIELMIAIIVVGILAAVAYPQYTEFVQRSRIADATSAMNDFRVRMEQFFQDNRTYVNGGACGVADPVFGPSSNFQILCTAPSATGYTLNANGSAAKGMSLFRYSLVVAPAGVTRSTISVHTGWSLPSPNNCWAVRRNGYCS